MAVELRDPGPIEFEATIQQKQMRNNLAEWVDFPFDLKETYGKGNLVPVIVTFDKKVKYQGSLAKMGGPKAMILLRNDVKSHLGKGGGDTIHVKVELDSKKRQIQLAQDVKSAFKQSNILEAFEKLAYSHQREYNQWIEDAKKPETRAARIQKAIDQIQTKS